MNFKTILLCKLFCFFFLAAAWEAQADQALPEKPLVVLITSYNNQEVVQENLASAFSQNYKNFRIIYIDDCSTDNSEEQVKTVVNSFPSSVQFSYIRNSKRIGALANIYHAVHSCHDEEIIVSLDGDDWFPHEGVLARINQEYSSGEVWLTHGSFIEYPTNKMVWSIPIPKEIVDAGAFRTYRCPSHLRTFYVWLFKKIKSEDLLYQGDFFQMTWDLAMMFPMIEMAGERHRFIQDVVYVYNTANPINDHKVNARLQKDLEYYIRAMPRYARLDKSPF